MRILLLAILSLAAGTALGVGISWARFGGESSASAVKIEDVASPATTAANSELNPRVQVDAESFDFGPVEADSLVSHAFTLTNVGNAPLTLDQGGTTCQKCTMAELERNELAPQASVKVVVSYQAAPDGGKFRQSATVLTNDPNRPRVELTVTGEVASLLRLEPRELVFSKLSVHDTASLEAKILNFVGDKLEVVGTQWSDPATAKFVTAEFTPLDAAAVASANAQSGQQLRVTIHPGLPLGQFRQTLSIDLKTPEDKQLQLDVQATVASDFSLVGAGWKADDGYLNIGAVPSKQGAVRKLMLLARGPQRHEVQVSVGEVTPNFLKITVGQRSEINQGAVVQFPLTIEIPPGSPNVNHLGSKLGKLARVIIETTHPEAKQVKIPIRFAVEE